MSENRNVRRFGWVVIGSVIAVCAVVALVFGSLLFMQLEGTYFLTPDRTDDVSVTRLHSRSAALSGEPIAADYVVRLSSGEEKIVSFPPGSRITVGDRLRLRYAQTRITGQVLVREFHRISEPEP
jgi:hypothetical protein